MAFRDHDMTTLVRREPTEAARQIAAKHAKVGFRMEETAASFGVNVRTLNRWVLAVGIGAQLRKARADAHAKARAKAAKAVK